MIRPFEIADIPIISAIAQYVFDKPWSREQFSQSLAQSNHHARVLLVDQQIVAYVIYVLTKNEAKILSIATHNDYQQCGHATQLLNQLLAHLKETSVQSVLLEVDEQNQPAVCLYQSAGFKPVADRKKYCQNGNNAKILCFDLAYMTHDNLPQSAQKITYHQQKISVPNEPIIPFIEGDGIGSDITPVMKQVIDEAVKITYGGKRKIHWLEIYAGQKSFDKTNHWLPQETLAAIKDYHVAIKGPLTTPIGGGMRSLNVAIRQELDLFVCQRPVQYFIGTPTPVKHPEKVDMVIFRENSEDIYTGIEYQQGSAEVKKLINFLQNEMGVTKIRFPDTSGIGIKPVSKEGTQRLVRSAIEYAIDNDKPSVTLVHKGNIMKFTEGGFRDWGYELAQQEFGATLIDNGSWCEFKNPQTGKTIIIKDSIADAFLQQILLRPDEYSVIATLNLNGDYISDALAAQVGGIGIAPGANLSDTLAVFEATHGSAPKYAGQDKVNPGSLILSAEMMLRHLGWIEVADLIISAMSKTILNKTVTYDLERLMDDAELVSCSGFGQKIIQNMR